ncbi:MAG: hypothetical protein H5T86_01250, partial [Armatimonadetes bacterium]|nr:hypothetical protein [Armatimonadota bacterium]
MARLRVSVAGVSAALLLSASLTWAARLPGEYLHEYTLEYITPHEPWAKSWAGGKLRAFFITPFNGAAREVAEVWQRADLEVFGETAASTRELGRAAGCFKDVEGTSPEEKRRRLAAKLSAGRYHVFVIGNVDWAAFPAETQYLMLKQVAEGAGLVIVYPSNVREAILKRPDPAGREWILHGIPLDAVPYFADTMRRLVEGRSMEAVAERLVRTYRAGKGRVVLIDYAARNDFQPCGGGMGLTPLEQFDFERPAYYEVYMALVLRAIHWAAGSVPELQLVGLPKRPMSVAPGEAPLVRVQIMGQPQWRGEALVRWRLVNCWNEPVASGEAPAKLAGGRGEATLRLPRFDGGRYFLRLFLDAAGKRHDFGILALRCRGAARLEEIAPIEDAQPPFGIGLRGRISPAGTRVAVELRDNYDRLFYVTDATAAPRPDREGSFEWRVPDEALALAVSSCVRARVKAFDGARVSDQAEVVLTRAKVLEDEYPVCMWGMMPGYVGHLAAVRIRELGFNIVLGSPTPDFARQLAVHDLGLIPYCTRIWDRRHFHDMDFVEKTEADLERTARSLARFRPHVYSLGDENAIPADFGWTEEDRPLLVEYLRRRYEDDLGALNRAWASNFSTWEE